MILVVVLDDDFGDDEGDFSLSHILNTFKLLLLILLLL